MTSKVEAENINLTETKHNKKLLKKLVKDIVKLNILSPSMKCFLYASNFTQVDHSNFKSTTRKEEIQNCKFKNLLKEKESKVLEGANIYFNVTTNVTVLVSNI